MIGQWIARFIFGFGLLFSTQIPHFMHQYLLVLSGAAAAYDQQIQALEGIAKIHGFASAQVMMNAHLNNQDSSVRDVAQEQLTMFSHYSQMKEVLAGFNQQNLLQNLWAMKNPDLHYLFEETVQHFEWGIPFTKEALIYGLAGGILLGLCLDLVLKVLTGLFRYSSKKTNLSNSDTHTSA